MTFSLTHQTRPILASKLQLSFLQRCATTKQFCKQLHMIYYIYICNNKTFNISKNLKLWKKCFSLEQIKTNNIKGELWCKVKMNFFHVKGLIFIQVISCSCYVKLCKRLQNFYVEVSLKFD